MTQSERLERIAPQQMPRAELSAEPTQVAVSDPNIQNLIAGGLKQVGITKSYDPEYRRIAYPMGDVPMETGVCTDVVIRALRDVNVDLQQLVHEDMKRNFGVYPKRWGLSKPDPNIDHRRVPNLQTYFTRKGMSLPISQNRADYRVGDIVTWKIGDKLDHIGLITHLRMGENEPFLVVHNMGSGTHVEDILFAWRITGHYRYF